MKYIRTKDGRILEFDKMITPCTYKTKPNKKGVFEEIGNGWIYGLANTIEELCDEFVDTSELKTTNTGGWLYDEFDSDNKCLVYYEHDERKTISLNEFDDLSKIRGAIWTDKGLIYVAKMNEKGELE